MFEHDNIIDVSESTFEDDVIQQSLEVPVVVDFWAPWCGPCRTLGPMLESLASEPEAQFILAKVNVDENPNLAIRYGVRSIPAVKAFDQGQIVAEFVGSQSRHYLEQFIANLVPGPEDMLFNEAESLLGTRHWAEAEDVYRDILDETPNDRAALLGLAKALIAQGEGGEALVYLNRIHDGAELNAAETLKPLARFLEEELEIDAEPADDVAVQYRQAARLLAYGNWEAGLDGLLEVLRHDKRYRGGAPRQVMLGVFTLLGDEDELAHQYRRELAFVLF